MAAPIPQVFTFHNHNFENFLEVLANAKKYKAQYYALKELAKLAEEQISKVGKAREIDGMHTRAKQVERETKEALEAGRKKAQGMIDDAEGVVSALYAVSWRSNEQLGGFGQSNVNGRKQKLPPIGYSFASNNCANQRFDGLFDIGSQLAALTSLFINLVLKHRSGGPIAILRHRLIKFVAQLVDLLAKREVVFEPPHLLLIGAGVPG